MYDNEFKTMSLKQREIRFKPRIKLNHNIYTSCSQRLNLISNNLLNRFHLWKADSANWPEQVSIKDSTCRVPDFFVSFLPRVPVLALNLSCAELSTYLSQPRWDKFENWFRHQTNKNQLCSLQYLQVKINYGNLCTRFGTWRVWCLKWGPSTVEFPLWSTQT